VKLFLFIFKKKIVAPQTMTHIQRGAIYKANTPYLRFFGDYAGKIT